MYDFIEGQVYKRRDIHDRYGGQRQGGISTQSGYPVIFLFTGQSYTLRRLAREWSDLHPASKGGDAIPAERLADQ